MRGNGICNRHRNVVNDDLAWDLQCSCGIRRVFFLWFCVLLMVFLALLIHVDLTNLFPGPKEKTNIFQVLDDNLRIWLAAIYNIFRVHCRQPRSLKFRMVSNVRLRGYLLVYDKKKLKKQFLGLPGKEIKRLKDEGTVRIFLSLTLDNTTWLQIDETQDDPARSSAIRQISPITRFVPKSVPCKPIEILLFGWWRGCAIYCLHAQVSINNRSYSVVSACMRCYSLGCREDVAVIM